MSDIFSIDEDERHVLSCIVDATLAEKGAGEHGWITGEWPYAWVNPLGRLCELELVEQDPKDLNWLRATEQGISLAAQIEASEATTQ